MVVTTEDIVREGKTARTKPPIILGGCDYIVDEFIKQMCEYEDLERKDLELQPVQIVDDSGQTYRDGHAIAKITGGKIADIDSDVVYVELSLDQFCDQNEEKLGISFGNRDTIPTVIIMNRSMYDVKNKTDRSDNYQLS